MTSQDDFIDMVVSQPRRAGKLAALPPVPFDVDQKVMRNPSDRSFTIAGMKISEEEFYNVHRALGNDESATLEHFMEQAYKQQKLAGYYGGRQMRHGTSRFNPQLTRRIGKSLLMSRFLAMERAEQDVVELLAQKMRDTYMPHHKGRDMEPWSKMEPERQVKWIEMAVVAIRELDKLGLMQ